MFKRIVSEIMLVLLLASVLTVAFNIQTVKASETIYIRSDGSVDPPTAPIQRNGDTYTLTGNITVDAIWGIEIYRNNMKLDGAGYTVQGDKTLFSLVGIYLRQTTNVTITNFNVRKCDTGIFASDASGNNIVGNNITENKQGIDLDESSNNYVFGNEIINNDEIGIAAISFSNYNTLEQNLIGLNFGAGIAVYNSSYNNIHGNNITWCRLGITLGSTSHNTFSSNMILSNSETGLRLNLSSNNKFYNNIIAKNTVQVSTINSVNVWDNGYSSGGNLWEDYNGVDANYDGIGDTPYVIDAQNQDRYPIWTTCFLNRTVSPSPSSTQTSALASTPTPSSFPLTTIIGAVIAVAVIIAIVVVVLVISRKRRKTAGQFMPPPPSPPNAVDGAAQLRMY